MMQLMVLNSHDLGLTFSQSLAISLSVSFTLRVNYVLSLHFELI